MMQARSSIFSFDRSIWDRPLSWCILFVILFWGADFLLRQSQYYRFRFGNRLGNAITVLKRHTAADSDTKSIVAFIGTSKMHSAIDPGTVNKFFPDKKCLNLSLNSMTFWEMFKLLQYSAAKGNAGKIDFIICEVAPFMFNANCLNPATRRELDNEFQLDIWCSRDDIFRQDSFQKSFSLIKKRLCGPWRLEDIFSALRNSVPEVLPPPVYHLDPELEKRLGARPAFSPTAAAEAHSHKFEFSPYSVYCFKQLLTYCRDNNIKLFLLELPSHQAYTQAVFKNISKEKMVCYQKLLNSSGARVIAVRDIRNYQLDNSVFVDYAHFTCDGKMKFSEKLGKLLHKEYHADNKSIRN